MDEQNVLVIKNMVCDRCISAVRNVVENTGANISKIKLGEVQLAGKPSEEQLTKIQQRLSEQGFELLEDRQKKIINQVKQLIIEKVHYSREPDKFKLGEFLSRKLPYSYSYLSQLFSDVEGITLEKYFILQKIERVKELIFYDEWTMGEISDQLGYSSVQHLSSQFKRVTGMSPSTFKKNRPGRKGLDQV